MKLTILLEAGQADEVSLHIDTDEGVAELARNGSSVTLYVRNIDDVVRLVRVISVR